MISLKNAIKNGLYEGLDFPEDLTRITKRPATNNRLLNQLINDNKKILQDLAYNFSTDIPKIYDICNKYDLKYPMPDDPGQYFLVFIEGCHTMLGNNIDLNWIDVSQCTDLSYIFYNRNHYTWESIDISSWNVSNVQSMHSMFNNCNTLTYVNLSNWNVKNLTDIGYMFYKCCSLRNLNLNNWSINLLNLKQYRDAFTNCNQSVIPDWYYSKLNNTI